MLQCSAVCCAVLALTIFLIVDSLFWREQDVLFYSLINKNKYSHFYFSFKNKKTSNIKTMKIRKSG